MGHRARREREKENMRNAILEAATKIITEEGYDKLTMRRVAEAIEYTPTTIYNYYEDKAQIVEDISRELYRNVISSVKNILTEKKDIPADKQLALCFKEFIFTITSNPKMAKAVMRSGTSAIFVMSDEDEPPEENGIVMLQDVLLRGRQQSVLRDLNENVPWMIVSSIIGFSINALENQLYQNENWSELVDIYVEFLMNGIFLYKRKNKLGV